MAEMEELWDTTPETPQPAASATSAAPPFTTPVANGNSKRAINTLACVDTAKKSSGRRNRSPWWAYFDKVMVEGLQKATCKYCSRQVGCDPRSGTSVLKNHIERCKANPPKLNQNEVFEQCSPTPLLAPAPAATTRKTSIDVIGDTWDKFQAATSVYQMMEVSEKLNKDPSAYGIRDWSSRSSEAVHGYKTGRAPWAIRETETSYEIRFDMPGLTRNDVKVFVEDNVLVIEADKANGPAEEGDWPVASYGSYENRIVLPKIVNAENVKAEVKDGILYISLPKIRAKGKRFDINVQ